MMFVLLLLGADWEVPLDPALFTERSAAEWNQDALELRPPAEPGPGAFVRTGIIDTGTLIPPRALTLRFDIQSTLAAPRITVDLVGYDEDGLQIIGTTEILNYQREPWSMVTWTSRMSGFGREPEESFRARASPLILPDSFTGVPFVSLELRADGYDGTEYRAGTVTFASILWITDVQEVPQFMRGDSNQDGQRDVGDAVASLLHLFAGAWGPPCLDAADVTDDGQVDLADPIRFLDWLFLDGAPLPEPILCGKDPTVDELRCGQGRDCE